MERKPIEKSLLNGWSSDCQHLSQLIAFCPEKLSVALCSAGVISERALNDILKLRGGELTANNYSNEMSRKLSEVVKKVLQADPGKMKAILEVVSKFSPEGLKQSNGRLSLIPIICAQRYPGTDGIFVT